jgi:hypothetical protein
MCSYRQTFRFNHIQFLHLKFVQSGSGSHRGSGGGGVIDFTQPGQNTYIRGRTNQLGNIAPSGILGNGRYTPNAQNVITSG